MMRTLVVVALLVPSLAAADEVTDHDHTIPSLAAANEVTEYDHTEGSDAVDLATDLDVRGKVASAGIAAHGEVSQDRTMAFDHGEDGPSDAYHLIVGATADVEARYGGSLPAGAHATGHAFFGNIGGYGLSGGGLFVTDVTAALDAGTIPRLDARRGVHREVFSRAGGEVEVVAIRGSGGRVRWDIIDAALGQSIEAQVGVTYRDYTMHMATLRRCRLRPRPAPDACLAILPVEARGVTGGQKSAIIDFYPATISGAAVGGFYVDAGIGVGGVGTMTISENDKVVETFDSHDLPQITSAIATIDAVHPFGAATLALHAGRDYYLSIDGNLSRDDRATVDSRGSSGPWDLAVRGFLASTTWWTAKADPGHRATTGGIDLGVSRKTRYADVAMSLAAGRSFYGALDGGDASHPDFACSERLTLRRNVHRVTW